MNKNTTNTKTGVVAMLNGKYWGEQRPGDYPGQKGWGPIENAEISDPKYCHKPTDKTHDPKNTNGHNPDYNELSKPGVKLVPITVETKIDYKIG